MLAAMKEEVAGLKRHTVIEKAIAQNGYQVFQGKHGGKEVLLVQTGVGREKAEKAARYVLERFPVTALISFGFAGALTGELGIGDVIVCSTLCCGDGQSDSTCQSDAGLLAQSSQVRGGQARRQGKSVTVAQPASQPEVKRALAQTFQADVVDMESYWIARIAGESRVPFLAVRVISDTLQEKFRPWKKCLMPVVSRHCRGMQSAIFFLTPGSW